MSGLSRKDRLKTNAFDFVNADQQKVRAWIFESEARFHEVVDRMMSSPTEQTAGQLRGASIKSLLILIALGLAIALTLGPAYASLGSERSYVPSTLLKDLKVFVEVGGSGGSGGWGGRAVGIPSRSTPQSGAGSTPRDSGGAAGTKDSGGLRGSPAAGSGTSGPGNPR